jgi:hypothetical protein
MTTFDEREHAFEAMYQHDEDLRFRIRARRAKLAGIWAAEHLGLPLPEVNEYVRGIIDADVEEPPVARAIVRHISSDFVAKGVAISEHRVEKEVARLLDVARLQVLAE